MSNKLTLEEKEIITALSTLSGIRPAVIWFAFQMERKLKANDHKGGWKKCTNTFLLGKLTEESIEIRESIKRLGTTPLDRINECADVANIAMMLAMNNGKLEADKNFFK